MVKELDHTKLLASLAEIRSKIPQKLLQQMRREYEILSKTQEAVSVKRIFKKFHPESYSKVESLSKPIPYFTKVFRYLLLRVLGHPGSPEKKCSHCGTAYALPTAFCSRKCASSGGCQSESVKAARRQTVLKRYGVTSVLNSRKVLEKKRREGIEKHGSLEAYKAYKGKELQQRVLKKYGVLNSSQSGELKEKIRQLRIRQHGDLVTFWSRVNKKRKATSIKRYGVVNYAQSPDWIKRRIKTLVEKHGSWRKAVEHQQQAYQQTSLRRYGTKYPIQNPVVYFSAKPRNRSKFYSLRLSDGSSIKLQGTAELRLAKLLNAKGYLLGEIVSGIRYRFQDKDCVYFPDFYVVNPTSGLVEVVEVKSTYTLFLHPLKNLAKFAAANAWCAENGMKFSLVVFKVNGSLVKIPWPTQVDIQTLRQSPSH